MLTLSESITRNYWYNQSGWANSRRTSCVTTLTTAGDGLCAGIWLGFRADSYAPYIFFIACRTAPANPQNTFYDWIFNGVATGIDSPNYSNTIIDQHSAGPSSWISADGAVESVITTYNDVFGTSATRQQIFEQLQRLYGSEYNYFAWGGSVGVSCPVVYGNYQWVFHQDPDTTSIGGAVCTNYPGQAVADGYAGCFSEQVAIEDEYLSVIGSNAGRAATYFIFREPVVTEKLRFNVYLDGVIGQKGPNIAINWTNTAGDASELSNVLIKPHIWTYPPTGITTPAAPTIGVDITQDQGGYVVPYDAMLHFNKTYTWDGSMQTDYVGMATTITAHYNMVNRVLLYGLDGIPGHIRFYLRFDYQEETGTTFGDLWYVDIPYEYEGAVYVTPAHIDDSNMNGLYQTEVIVIGGTPPEEPSDDPDSTEPGYDGTDPDPSGNGPYPLPDLPDITGYESTGYPGQAVLTKTYKMTSARLQNLGNKLWTQSYFDVLKVQTNPIENIIACRWYPMSVTTVTADQDVVVGDVNTGVKGDVVGTTYKKTIGSYKYTGTVTSNGKSFTLQGYLGYSPYTTIKLYLPYVGVIQLDATEIFNRTLSVEYIVDLITGDLIVFLKLNGFPYMNLSGKMGVDIPLSGTDRAQVQIASASRALTATIGAAGHLMSGDMLGGAGAAASGMMSMAGIDYSTQRVITHSSVCASYENRAIIMEIQGPKAYKSDGYAKQHGFPSNIYTKITKGIGFIKVAKRSVINVAMSDTENRELEQILTSGCYF